MNSINFITGQDKKYYRRNYVDVLELLTPTVYKEADITTSGYEVSIYDKVIKSHINVANYFNSIFNISGTTEGSSFGSLSGASQYFIKQNRLTEITPYDFESKILYPSQQSLKNYENSSLFSEFLESTLLPSIRLNSPTELFDLDSAADAHDYLINELSWLYILNKQYDSNLVYQPSATVKNLFLEKTYNGKPIMLSDAMKALNTFLWYNYNVCSLFQRLELVPSEFLSGTGKYTSGTQQLDKLNTITEILYSPLRSDDKDTIIKKYFDYYQSTSEHAINTEKAGPFHKFLKSIAWGIYDVNDQVENLNLLYDINRCPEELLPLLAYTIGWSLYGNNPSKWRQQVKNAVQIYKSVGTKRGLNLALNSVFGQTSLDLSASVQELYESYIPNLLYYCIATDSPLVSSFESWTPQLAGELGIRHHTLKSMDTNIRYIVDSILEDAVRLFPNHFYISPNLRFNLEDPDFVFSYRDVPNNKIPPWELEKYYRYCKISDALLSYFEERLVCLAVSRSVAEQTINYIRDNTIENVTNIGLKNNFLFFTLSPQYPPNYTHILSNFDKQKTKILPIWNGKSSTFNLSLESSSFEFDKYSFLIGSSEGLKAVLKTVIDFSPAHAIPDIDLGLSTEDEMFFLESFEQANTYSLFDLVTASSVLAGFNNVGLQMSSLGRIFKREDVDSLTDPVFTTGSSFSNLHRNTLRRRNYRNNLPKDGWFTRSGFNMPPHHVVDKNTISYSTRGECDPIIALIHKKIEEKAYADASASLQIESFASAYSASGDYMNLVVSLANTSAGPNSADEFFDFEFGRGLHKLYLIYDKVFGLHTLSWNSDRNDGGFNIFAQTFGTALFNGNFEINGATFETYPQLITSSFDSEVRLGNGDGSGVFSNLGTASGTVIANSPSDYYLNRFEFRNASLVSGVELIIPSGAGNGTYFSLFDIDPINQREDTDNYAIDNRIIKMAVGQSNGLPRIRFNLSAHDNPPSKLIPEHEFKLQIPFFVGQTTGLKYGGGSLKVWIHTDVENGYVWSWTPQNQWKITAVSSLTTTQGLNKIRNELAHNFDYQQETPPSSVVACYYAQESGQVNNYSLENLTESSFKIAEINFNTNNPPICIPNYYYSNGTQVHRLNQNYIIEIFMDQNPERYILIDKVNLVDSTLHEYASGYTEEEIQDLFRFFKSLALNLASRVSSTTSGTFEAQGGSRMEYRYHPEFGTFTKAAGGQFTSINILR